MSEPHVPASPPQKPFSSKQPKVFDIRRPGRAIASPTSRPVIAPPTVKDSLLIVKPHLPPAKGVPLKSPTDDVAPPRSFMRAHKTTRQPAEPKTPLGDAPVPTTHAGTNGALGMAAAAPTHEGPASAVPPVMSSAAAEMPARSAAAEADDVLANTAAPTVDMSHAVISSRVTPRRVWREVLVVLGLLLFVVAVSDILLDAGIVAVQGVPHTHLFANRP